MHRFIFIATFLPAVFLMDLLASSASVPEEPLSARIQIAAALVSGNSLSAIKAAETRPPRPTTPVTRSKAEFVCGNALFSFVLDQLRAEDFVGLGENYVDGFIRAAEIGNCTELFEIEEETDLNGDGRKEIILRTRNNLTGSFFCGATGNCQTWVIGREKNGYRIILDANSIEEVKVQSGKTGGYYDLEVRGHGGMMNHTLAYYKYRTGKYTLQKCLAETMDTYGKSYSTFQKLSDCR